MLPKPEWFGEEYASAFQERGVALAYQHRPPYPHTAIAILAGLMTDTPRRALDVGCGTGFIARHLAELADHVDALDVSQAMIDEGRRLPNGDHPRLSWIVGRAEDAPLSPPYALITAGESLHWLDWEIALPRFARLLAPNGWLAIVQSAQLPVAWDAELLPIIQRYSIFKKYQSVDIVAELEQRGLFRKYGGVCTESVAFRQSIDEYIESFHGRASLTRERLATAAAAFDAEIRRLVARFSPQIVELQMAADITWGKPLTQ
ncbi:MAG: class I SAM-dependent methyltransferase [Roseiflexaceae bacterium]